LIVAGIAATAFIPGVGAFIGAALIGAGVSGLQYDVENAIAGKNGSTGGWLLNLGVGAVVGVISEGAGMAIGGVLSKMTTAGVKEVASLSGSAFAKGAAKIAARESLRVGLNGAKGAGTSVLSKIGQNLINHDTWDHDLGSAAIQGAIFGIVSCE